MPTDARAEAYRRFSELPKVATFDDRLNETDEDRRMRRIGEFLRQRKPSGLSTGTASPTPPKDATP